MLIHYLKVAFRSLWKYKTQSVITIVVLGVGFACFALATLWIRYEMTYDAFHKDSDRMYRVGRSTAYALADYLKKTFPEVEGACAVQKRGSISIKTDDGEYKGSILCIDTAALRVFDIRILEGSRDFMIPGSDCIAVTETFAHKLSPDGNVIGLKIDGMPTVCAVVKAWEGHSNLQFDILAPIRPDNQWANVSYNTFLKIKQGMNTPIFRQKLAEHKIDAEGGHINKTSTTPISKMRYKDGGYTRGFVNYEYIILFGVIGLLIVICVFVNYFTLLSSHFRIRSKELGIRKVCGANQRSFFVLFLTEFLITLFLALLLGLFFINLVSSQFFRLSNIDPTFYNIYRGAFVFVLLLIIVSSCFFYIFLQFLHKRTLQNLIRHSRRKSWNFSLAFQLVISIGFVFASSIILKQIHFLNNTDLGFDYKNTATMSEQNLPREDLSEKLKEMPEIEQVIVSGSSLLPLSYTIWVQLEWDEMPDNPDIDNGAQILYVNADYVNFYKLRLITGNLITEKDGPDVALISESTLKLFGWTGNPIGKNIVYDGNNYKVKGVIQDIYYSSPEYEADPLFLVNKTFSDGKILFRYKQGTRAQIESKIQTWIETDYPGATFRIDYASDIRDREIRSENALLKILGFSALACVIISIFGFYSIVSLVCEKRRKELAIRKINGATMKTILSDFSVEYLILLFAGAVIAFSVTYIIMHRWLEHYVLRIRIPVWMYILIFLVFAAVIALSVGRQIYKVARENPADVLKTE